MEEEDGKRVVSMARSHSLYSKGCRPRKRMVMCFTLGEKKEEEREEEGREGRGG